MVGMVVMVKINYDDVGGSSENNDDGDGGGGSFC